METVSNAHGGYIKTMGLFSPALDFTAKRLLQLVHGVFSHLLAPITQTAPCQAVGKWLNGGFHVFQDRFLGKRGKKLLVDAANPKGKKCLHKIGRALVELEKSYEKVFGKKPFLNNFTNLSISDCLRLKRTFEEVNSKNGRVGAYRCQELAALITKRGHLIEKGANISDLYDFGKKLYDKKVEGFIFDMTFENIGEMGGDVVSNLGLAPAIAVPFRDIVGTFVGRFCGTLMSYSLIAGAVYMTPGKLDRKVPAAVLGAFVLGTLNYLEMNPVMALSILGAEVLAENLIHFSMTLMTAYVGMKMMGTGESFEDYVRNMIFASAASKGLEKLSLMRGNEGFWAQIILPYLVAHFVYNLSPYASAFRGTFLQESRELFNQSIQDVCEKSAMNKAIKEGLNKSIPMLENLTKEQLSRLDLGMVEVSLQEICSIQVDPFTNLPYKDFQIESGIERLIGRPIGLSKKDVNKAFTKLKKILEDNEMFSKNALLTLLNNESKTELVSMRAPLVGRANKWIEKQNLIPSKVLAKNILDLSRVLSEPNGHGVFIQKFNQFYERKVKGELNPLFDAFHERLTRLQEETMVETLVHPDRLPTIEKRRVDIIEGVIQGKIPQLPPSRKRALKETFKNVR